MYFKLKSDQYWVWSSKKASLDCMPWYKFDSIYEMKLFFASKVKYAAVDNKFEKSVKMKNKRLYSWAANLNK